MAAAAGCDAGTSCVGCEIPEFTVSGGDAQPHAPAVQGPFRNPAPEVVELSVAEITSRASPARSSAAPGEDQGTDGATASSLVEPDGKSVREGTRRDLPGQAPAVPAPATLAFVPAIVDDCAPVAVGFFLTVGGDLEGERLVVLELRAGV